MIDLCVVNHNSAILLKRMMDTLHSDLDTVEKVWKLYITDNGSTDSFVDFMRSNSHNYDIDNLYLRNNIGYSAACNDMASRCNSDIVALLNGDIWMTSADVNRVQEIFDEDRDIHILGVKQRDESGRITHAGVVGTGSKPVIRGWMLEDKNDLMFKDRINCITVFGSAFFVRKDIWDEMTNHPEYRKIHPEAKGAFLPTPHYYEETWCAYFARHLGYNVVYDGTVSIGHSWHASTPRPNEGVSEVDKLFPVSREIFRKACDHFGIERD